MALSWYSDMVARLLATDPWSLSRLFTTSPKNPFHVVWLSDVPHSWLYATNWGEWARIVVAG